MINCEWFKNVPDRVALNSSISEDVESQVCLKVVADALKSGALRPISCVVSWPDEEFCVFLQRG